MPNITTVSLDEPIVTVVTSPSSVPMLILVAVPPIFIVFAVLNNVIVLFGSVVLKELPFIVISPVTTKLLLIFASPTTSNVLPSLTVPLTSIVPFVCILPDVAIIVNLSP